MAKAGLPAIKVIFGILQIALQFWRGIHCFQYERALALHDSQNIGVASAVTSRAIHGLTLYIRHAQASPIADQTIAITTVVSNDTSVIWLRPLVPKFSLSWLVPVFNWVLNPLQALVSFPGPVGKEITVGDTALGSLARAQVVKTSQHSFLSNRLKFSFIISEFIKSQGNINSITRLYKQLHIKCELYTE
ncbi:hypothetical protein O9929_03295 [Vibrio lentus]|nr:hypothetical protein [Vibrio lentus]